MPQGVSQARTLPLVDDGDPVAQLICLDHVMGGQQQRAGGIIVDPAADEAAHLTRSAHIQPRVGSSRKSTSGSVRKPRTIFIFWRKPVERSEDLVLSRSAEPDNFEQLVDALVRLRQRMSP